MVTGSKTFFIDLSAGLPDLFIFALPRAQVAKLVDALPWGGSAGNGVLVRIQSWARYKPHQMVGLFPFKQQLVIYFMDKILLMKYLYKKVSF